MQFEDELFPRDGYLQLFDALGSTDKRLHAHPGYILKLLWKKSTSGMSFCRLAYALRYREAS